MDTKLTFFEVIVFILRQCRGIRTPTLGYQAIGTVAGMGGGGGGGGLGVLSFFLRRSKAHYSLCLSVLLSCRLKIKFLILSYLLHT